MKNIKRWSILGITLGVLHSPQLSGQAKQASIQGVWKAVEVTVSGTEARKISQIQPNLTIITARHYSRIEVHAEGPRSAPADFAKASADELRNVWGPFVGEAGTYDLTGGNRITMRPIVAKNPAAPGSFTTYSFKLEGDTLWVTYEKNQNGPIPNPVTIKCVRAE